MSTKPFGKVLIFTSLFTTLCLFTLSLPSPKILIDKPLWSLSQIFSLLGLTTLCFTFILSSRLRTLERIFGPLDRVYRLHASLGLTSFIFILNHPLLLLIDKYPSPGILRLYLLPGKILSYNLGIFALYLFITLVAITIYTRLPYHLWKSTHNFFGLVIILGSLHAILIAPNVRNFLPLAIWIVTLSSTAFLCYIYKRFLYTLIGPAHHYTLTTLTTQSDLLELTLSPTSKPLHFAPGQFVFARFPLPFYDREPHPFSISSSPDSPYIRLSIKLIGDFTRNLTRLAIGDPVQLIGPYGQLTPPPDTTQLVLLAGGIGITPFLSILENPPPSVPIHLFHTVRTSAQAYYREQLSHLSAKFNFHYHLIVTDTDPRLTVERIRELIINLDSFKFLLCGPRPMMADLESQLLTHRIKRRNIILEDFSLL